MVARCSSGGCGFSASTGQSGSSSSVKLPDLILEANRVHSIYSKPAALSGQPPCVQAFACCLSSFVDCQDRQNDQGWIARVIRIDS
jgi:hypothetical protein